MFNYSEGRKAWQDFKKRNPNFDKLKGVKANFGPLLDQAEAHHKKAIEAYTEYVKKMKEAKTLDAKFLEVCKQTESAGRLAAAAFEEYYKAIKNSGDQKMIKDFEANSMPIMKKVALALGAAERAKAITHLQPS
jgi:hypothetical protein